MQLATVYTRALVGIQAPEVTVEVHISNGLPGTGKQVASSIATFKPPEQ